MVCTSAELWETKPFVLINGVLICSKYLLVTVMQRYVLKSEKLGLVISSLNLCPRDVQFTLTCDFGVWR